MLNMKTRTVFTTKQLLQENASYAVTRTLDVQNIFIIWNWVDVIYHNVKVRKLAMINFPFIHLQIIVHGSATQKVGDSSYSDSKMKVKNKENSTFDWCRVKFHCKLKGKRGSWGSWHDRINIFWNPLVLYLVV